MTDVLFLPGIIAPATIRYAPLLAELPGVRGVPKDLEVYRDDAPPEDYSISTEIDGVDRAAHLHTSHQAQPERVAAALRGLWRGRASGRMIAVRPAPAVAPVGLHLVAERRDTRNANGIRSGRMLTG